ncbi:MAG: sulfurtransferase [Isosphaeraceae bacterium]|jgi:rhodanese-related sulfurtransferase|nr:MAG: sulfurtransferase [Isosphaeraceae bacterium]
MNPQRSSTIAPVELRRRIDSGEAIGLLDVREPIERAFCAIPAPAPVLDLFIPLPEVPARVDEIATAARTRTLVVYCHHGLRSERVRQWLAERGVGGLLNLHGGIDAYSVEADPDIPRYF